MINMDAEKEKPVSSECFEHGRKLREARITAGKTLCDIENDSFLDLVAASRIERGLIHNLHITPDEWAGKSK